MIAIAGIGSVITCSVMALSLVFWKKELRKFRIWIVDDRDQNLQRFQRDHGSEFDIRTFSTPNDVLDAFRNSRPPDALLCDIYFYEDVAKREGLEEMVNKDVEALKKSAAKFDPENAQLGIDLIRAVRARFAGSPKFPIYAYTSKGPYLLQGRGYDDLERLDVAWLFKNRGGAAIVEREAISRDIALFRDRYSWPKRIWRAVILVGASAQC